MTLLLLVLAGQAFGQAGRYGQNIYVEGEVSGHWAADTVFVTGDIYLPPFEYLEIMPGVRVEFQGYYGFVVQGEELHVVGTPQAPIVFTVNDTTGLHDIYIPDGGWKGITIWGDLGKGLPGPSVDFQHVHIEYAKAIHGQGLMHGGGLYVEGSGQFGFYRTTFFRNQAYLYGGGAYVQHASPGFIHCHFIENKAGHPPSEEETYGAGGGLFGKHSKALLQDSRFEGNWASGVGGGLCLDSADVSVFNNVFKYNYAMIGGAISYLRSAPSTGMANNLVAFNEATFFGGGIAMLTYWGHLVNNTIVYNHTVMGGGIYLNEDARPLFRNTILWGNTAYVPNDYQMFTWDSVSSAHFYYSLVEGGTDGFGGAGFDGDFVSCLQDDPMFMEEGDHPFALQAGSPAIVAGCPDTHELAFIPQKDLAGNARIMNDRIDIGAYELQDDITFVCPDAGQAEEMALQVYPHPATGSSILSFSLCGPARVSLQLHDALGRTTGPSWQKELPAGKHAYSLQELFGRGQLDGGTWYVLSLTAGHRTGRTVVLTTR